MSEQDQRLREIWHHPSHPVVYRQGEGKPVLVRLPFHEGNYEWLRNGRRFKPKWDGKFRCWKTPTSWFDNVVKEALQKFGKVYVVQRYREQQKCAPACWNAQGFHCECSCMGTNHGSGHPGGQWNEVSETFAVNWGEKKYSCRLIISKC